MKAQQLDKRMECPICNGDGVDPVMITCDQCDGEGSTTKGSACNNCGGLGKVESECRRCGGEKEINRYGPNELNDAFKGPIVILSEEIAGSNALHVESIPITEKKIGGFNERYGPDVVDDSSSIRNFSPDIRDQLQNQWGSNTIRRSAYEIPSGERFSRSDFGGQWPDPDMRIGQIIEWMELRNDTHTAKLFKKINSEVF